MIGKVHGINHWHENVSQEESENQGTVKHLLRSKSTTRETCLIKGISANVRTQGVCKTA